MQGSTGLGSYVKKSSNKVCGEVTHKFEPKELQATQHSEGLQVTDSSKDN